MCGRYLLEIKEDDEEIRQIYEKLINRRPGHSPEPIIKTGEIFPTDTVPVLFKKNEQETADLFKWGFPHPVRSGVIINARAETVHEKVSFRQALTAGRCLIPASGYFEWTKEGTKKVKHLISSANKKLIFFAGLYRTFFAEDGSPYQGFVIITTAANPQISSIHDRMPVILEEGHAQIWLDAAIRDPVLLQSLLVPFGNPLTAIVA